MINLTRKILCFFLAFLQVLPVYAVTPRPIEVDGVTVNLFPGEYLEETGHIPMTPSQCNALGYPRCDSMTYFYHPNPEDRDPNQKVFGYSDKNDYFVMNDTYITYDPTIGELQMYENLQAHFSNDAFSYTSGDGLVVSGSSTNTNGLNNYNGPNFVSQSIQTSYVDADGNTHTTISTSTHYNEINITQQILPKEPDVAMRILRSKAPRYVLEEPILHPFPLHFAIKSSGDNSNWGALINASNKMNEMWPNKDAEFNKTKAAIDQLEIENANLKQSIDDVAVASQEFNELSKEELEKGNELIVIEASNDPDDQLERVAGLSQELAENGYFEADPDTYFESINDAIVNQEAQIASLSNQMFAETSNMDLSSASLVATNELAADFGAKHLFDMLESKNTFDDDFDFDKQAPEIPPGKDLPELPSDDDPFGEPEKPSGEDMLTPPTNPNYGKIVDALDYYEASKSVIDFNNEGAREAYDLAAVGLEMADKEYSEGRSSNGDTFLKNSLGLLDAAIDFVPGASLLKDSIGIVTGKNPITGEVLSDTERTVMLATLFAPAIIAGSAKVVTKAAEVIKDIAKKGGDQAENLEGVGDAIDRADDALKKYTVKDQPDPVTGAPTDEVLERFSTARKPDADGSPRLIGKKVQALADTSPGAYYEGVEDIWLAGTSNTNPWRDNLKRLVDPDMPSDVEAHHIFPKELEEPFKKAGLWVHDPRVMAPIPKEVHSKLHSETYGGLNYNDQWRKILNDNPGISREELLSIAKDYFEVRGVSEYLTGYF